MAATHLLDEGIATNKIMPVGDVMFDVALHHGARVDSRGGILAKLEEQSCIKPSGYCLGTVHRAENTDHPDRLSAIVDSLSSFSDEMPVVWPLHPRIRKVLANQCKLEELVRSVCLIDPVGYLDMVQLES